MKKTLVLCLVSIISGLCNAAEYIPNTKLLERTEHTPKYYPYKTISLQILEI